MASKLRYALDCCLRSALRTLDDHAHRARAAHRAQLAQLQVHAAYRELLKNDAGAVFGQRLHQSEGGLADELDHALAHRLVVERVGNIVTGGGHAVVEIHLDVELHRLADAALPVVDADHAVDFQRLDEDLVHGFSFRISLYRRQPGHVPARLYAHLAALVLPGHQAQRTGEGDHRAVVGAEGRAREVTA